MSLHDSRVPGFDCDDWAEAKRFAAKRRESGYGYLAEVVNGLESHFAHLDTEIIRNTVESREQNLALEKLREAQFWVAAAFLRGT